MKLFISLVVVVLLCASPGWAGCKSDCANDYESEVNSCKTQYDDPENAEELQMCFDNAKVEYDECVNECED